MLKDWEPKLSNKEIEKLIEDGKIHRSDAYDPELSDKEKIAISEGKLQSPEND